MTDSNVVGTIHYVQIKFLKCYIFQKLYWPHSQSIFRGLGVSLGSLMVSAITRLITNLLNWVVAREDNQNAHHKTGLPAASGCSLIPRPSLTLVLLKTNSSCKQFAQVK